MTDKIDWSGWTEEYPLWIDDTENRAARDWHKDCGHYYIARDGSAWNKISEIKGRIIVHRRPETVAWDGEGLPPVGAECEYSMTSGKRFKPCFFVGIKSTGSYVIESHDGELKSYHPYQVVFRPIPTPEQKAAQERERAIDEMEKVIMGSVSIRDGVTKLYSIGYRYYDGGES